MRRVILPNSSACFILSRSDSRDSSPPLPSTSALCLDDRYKDSATGLCEECESSSLQTSSFTSIPFIVAYVLLALAIVFSMCCAVASENASGARALVQKSLSTVGSKAKVSRVV